jgi:hypothetical protein
MAIAPTDKTMLSGAIGMPVGAVIAIIVSLLLLTAARRRGLLDSVRGPGARTGRREGYVGSAIVGLVNLGIVAAVFERLTEPWWLYLLYWVVAVALPFSWAAVWFNATARKMGDEWVEFVQRRRQFRELPPLYKRRFRVSLGLAILPGVVLGLILFAPDM